MVLKKKKNSGHLICHLECRRGTGKGSSLSSTHISPICLQYICPALSQKGKEGVYYKVFKKKAIAIGKFFMISAKEISSCTK